ncbi:hypothetical protein ACHAPT_000099 [Fusarium lateritium]
MNLHPKWDPLTHALDFAASLWDIDRDRRAYNAKNIFEFVKDYIGKTYKVDCIAHVPPFIFLRCPESSPAEKDRPFTIARELAVWQIPENTCYLWDVPTGLSAFTRNVVEVDFVTHIGSLAGSETPPDEHLVLWIANHLAPQCIAMSKLGHDLWIEFAKRPEPDFKKLVRSLPKTKSKNIWFHNGPIPNPPPEPRNVPITQPVQSVEEAPKQASNIQSDTMLRLASHTRGTSYCAPASLLVCRGQDIRLAIYSYYPEGGHSLRIRDTDQIIGQVEMSLKNTGIGLATLDDSIELDEEISFIHDIQVRSLVHSSQLGMCEPGYFADLPTTGLQPLYRFGERFEITRDASRSNSAQIGRRQSAYLTNDSSKFADHGQVSICGAIIMRRQEVVEDGQAMFIGEACGMINSDYLPVTSSLFFPFRHIVWADDFDDLIKEGWDAARWE